jgi:hypothetical protein
LEANKSLKPTVTPVTLFAEKAKPAPRYGGLVPPFYMHFLGWAKKSIKATRLERIHF